MGQDIKLTASDNFQLGGYRADPKGAPKGAVVEVWGLQTSGGPGFGPGAGGGRPSQPVFGFTGAPVGKWELLGTQSVGFGNDRDSIRVGRQEGGFRRILLRVRENDIDLQSVRVIYGNGEPDNLAFRQIIRAGGTSGPLDLRGDVRAIERIDMTYRSNPNRRGQAIVEVWGLHAEGGGGFGPGPGGRPGLVLLGEQTVGFGVDRDVIRISHGEDFYRRERPFRNLHIAAERNDVHLMSIRITYLNGFAENWSIDRLIRAGSETVIDLRGDRSYLRQIEMVYRSRPSFKGQAVVRVFGAVGGR